MIKIDTSKIKNWDIIKENHVKFIKSIIEDDYKESRKTTQKEIMDELLSEVITYIDENIDSIFIGEREIMLKCANELRKLTFKDIDEYELDLLDKFFHGRKQSKDKIINEIKGCFTGPEYKLALDKFMKNIKEECNRCYEKKQKDDFIDRNYQHNLEGEKFIQNIKKECSRCYGKKHKDDFIDQNYPQYREGLKINSELSSLFDYDKLVKGREGWDRHKLISDMKLEVCPYCNRQYISAYNEDSKCKTTADLDHFYPKSIYPILGLSLYNFIPSCQLCNSRLKLDKDFKLEEHIYPYEESFDDYGYYFTTYPNSEGGIDYLKAESDQFELEIKCSNKVINSVDKVENSKKTFKLEALYRNHKDYVFEIIKKAIIYNDDYIEFIESEFSELFESKEEIIRLIFSNYIDKDELHRRPLAKLTKDICNEFEITL